MKALDSFPAERRRPDGRGSWCLQCGKSYRENLKRRKAEGEVMGFSHERPALVDLKPGPKPDQHSCGAYLTFPMDMDGRVWEQCSACRYLKQLTPV